jgi:RNA-directed DNA polymerase
MMFIKRLAKIAGIDVAYIKELSNRATYLYRSFDLKSGRTVHAPSTELKGLQILINKTLFDRFPVHNSSTAYSIGCSSYKNALAHVGNFEFTTRIDFKKFFTSITGDDINKYLTAVKDKYKLTSEDIVCIVKLVTRNNKLTIGSPTSPKISNALCYYLDDKISSFAAEREIVYTRYSDDLCFSYNDLNKKAEILQFVKLSLLNIPYPSEVKINYDKLLTRKHNNGRKVTGLIVNGNDSCNVGLGKKKVKYYNSMMRHYFIKHDSRYTHEMIVGHLNYIKQADIKYFEALVLNHGGDLLKLLTSKLPSPKG